MKKQLEKDVNSEEGKVNGVIPVVDDLQVTKAGIQEIKSDAEKRLVEIISRTSDINDLRAECEAEMRKVTEKYTLRIEARTVLLTSAIKALMQTMKFNKTILFAATDVVNLPHGSLIRNVGDKVSIPHTALDACKLFGYTEAIKVVESLDRDAIEKWPDAKLTLIGAERKSKEEFKYALKTGGPDGRE